MVQLMLDGLRGNPDFKIFHVNARVSDNLADVGGIRPGKVFRLLGYCAQAIWNRLRHGADTLYYIPAPAKKSAIVRDRIIMLSGPALVQRNHSSIGMPSDSDTVDRHVTSFPLDRSGPALEAPLVFGNRSFERFARWLTRRLLGRVDLSIVLTEL